MAGHDHCQEHIVETGSLVNLFVIGMGVECCYLPSNLASIPTGAMKWYIASNNAAKSITGGFASFEAQKTGLVVTYYDQDGNTLYATSSIAPRTV